MVTMALWNAERLAARINATYRGEETEGGVTEGGGTSSNATAAQKCPPRLTIAERFPQLGDRGTIDCEKVRSCFPLDPHSDYLCPSRCIFQMKGDGGDPHIIKEMFYQKNVKNEYLPYKLREILIQTPPALVFVVGAPGSGKSTLRKWFKAWLTGELKGETEKIALGQVNKIKDDAIVRDSAAYIGERFSVDIDVDRMYKSSIDEANEQIQKEYEGTTDIAKKTQLEQMVYWFPRYIADQLSNLVFFQALACRSHITMELTSFSPHNSKEGDEDGIVEYWKMLATSAKHSGYEIVVLYADESHVNSRKAAEARQTETGQVSKPFDKEQVARAKRSVLAFQAWCKKELKINAALLYCKKGEASGEDVDAYVNSLEVSESDKESDKKTRD